MVTSTRTESTRTESTEPGLTGASRTQVTRIAVTPAGCRLSHGPLAARRLRANDPRTIRVALVATQALLLSGDHVRIEIDVRGDLALEVLKVAGTVAYDMRGGSARWDAHVQLADGAQLTWLGEPFVVAAGAEVLRSTTLVLEPNTSATLRESLVFGRSGEAGGSLFVSTRATYDGQPLLIEDLDLSPAARSGFAVLGRGRCLDSLTRLGERLPDQPGILQLAGPGSIVRWIGSAMHESTIHPATASSQG